MKGRKKKPTAKKKLDGTLRRDRLNKKEPQPKDDATGAPKWLSKKALPYWAEIEPQLKAAKILKNTDTIALATLCDAIAMYVATNKAMWPLCQKTKKGNLVQNPNVSLNRQALERMHKMLTEFGMTPSSRTRVTAEDETPADAWEALANES